MLPLYNKFRGLTEVPLVELEHIWVIQLFLDLNTDPKLKNKVDESIYSVDDMTNIVDSISTIP